MKLSYKRNHNGYSLIETMTVVSVIAIVLGLLYAYSDQGWKLFYQSYTRGLSQVKARLAIRTITDELREANKNRITTGSGNTYGIPLPDDTKDGSPYIYFTKPKSYEEKGDVIGYDYVLFYFARPKEKIDPLQPIQPVQKKKRENQDFLTLRSIKFLNQSKSYTEDESKTWPFLPPILEIGKSILPEDEGYLESVKANSAISSSQTQTPQADSSNLREGKSDTETNSQENVQSTSTSSNNNEQDQFLDHFSKLKKASKNISISGNFLANNLTDPFTKEEATITFNQPYSVESPIKIKVMLVEPSGLFGLTAAMSEFEVSITPRN